MYKITLIIINILALISVILLAGMTMDCTNNNGYYCGMGWILFTMPVLAISFALFFLDSLTYYFFTKNIKEIYPLGVLIALLVIPVFFLIADLDLFWSQQYFFDSPPVIIVYIIFSYFYRIRIYSKQKENLNLMEKQLKTDAELRVEFIREMRSYGIQNVTEEMIQDYIQGFTDEMVKVKKINNLK